MKEKTSFLGSHRWKKFVNVAYNLGASVVIIGAMFKILHLPYGDMIIGIGMLSEAILFAITAIDPVGYDYHWEKVFPSLVSQDQGRETPEIPQNKAKVEDSLSSKLDKILSQAGIDARLMQNLSDGINRLSRHAQGLSNMGEVGQAAQNYTSQINIATQRLEALNRIYGNQIEQLGQNEDNIRQITSSMGQVAQASSRVSGEIKSLADNMASLNVIYGSVLNAMGGSARL